MSELVSAYPTAGRPVLVGAKLGGPAWAWFTGWFNMIGLIAVDASIDYAARPSRNALLTMYGVDLGFINLGDASTSSPRRSCFRAHPRAARSDQHLLSHLVATLNTISVFGTSSASR